MEDIENVFLDRAKTNLKLVEKAMHGSQDAGDIEDVYTKLWNTLFLKEKSKKEPMEYSTKK